MRSSNCQSQSICWARNASSSSAIACCHWT